ncbi:hypothetical protein WJX82_010409 [Trebouxia sp. C0006]
MAMGTLRAAFAGLGLEAAAQSGNVFQSRGSTFNQRPIFSNGQSRNGGVVSLPRQNQARVGAFTQSAAAFLDAEYRPANKGQRGGYAPPVPEYLSPAYPSEQQQQQQLSKLPQALYRLLDPQASVDLPSASLVTSRQLDNRELDKLFAALGRNKATWRRALVLHEWLLSMGHTPDDRLCTTLIRVCSQHGQAMTALSLYDWMRSSHREGGAGLVCTVYTYTAAMRAALTGNMIDRAIKVWDDALVDGCQPDCRMATTLIEVCTRKGDTSRALATYQLMQEAALGSNMAPSVHAYTAAMRAAAEGGAWEKALDIWSDMEQRNCKPTGHAYAAVISACAAGGAWQRAVQLFDQMLQYQIKPDVVSCTALITALGADGQWKRGSQVVDWMLRSGVKPNVRTYTALITAMGNAQKWDLALDLIKRMKIPQAWGCVEPNAYTYSALLKTMGEQGHWQMAEKLFQQLEVEAHASARSPWLRLMTGGYHLAALEICPPTLQNRCLTAQLMEQGARCLMTSLDKSTLLGGASNGGPARWGLDMRGTEHKSKAMQAAGRAGKGPVNEVVCGAMMLAYERAGKWEQAVTLLDKSRAMGIIPNTIMYNTAMSSLGKSGQWEAAERLFGQVPEPDAVTYETLIAAYGMAGQANLAEIAFKYMLEAHHTPRDYAYCGLIAAHSMQGNWKAALRVRSRMRQAGAKPTVHVYNALIAACERSQQLDAGVDLSKDMRRDNVEANHATCQEGIYVDALVPAEHEVVGEDQYVCFRVDLPKQSLKIVGVDPLSTQDVVHHMLLFGCANDGPANEAWPCHMTSPCRGGFERVLYGWGKNAPAMTLPTGVGYGVGPGSAMQSLVLQVHYLQERPAGDQSGIRLRMTSKSTPFSAGMINYASYFTIPPGKPKHPIENQCCYSGFEILKGFAFRVHTHALGRSVNLERIEQQNGKQVSNELCERDPQLPQGFAPIKDNLLIRPGDTLKATCMFDSSAVHSPVNAGATHNDEMCNLYLMLYSQLPFFMACYGSPQVDRHGMGGIPPAGRVELDMHASWQPPGPLGAPTLGPQPAAPFAFGQAPAVVHLDQDAGAVLSSWGENLFLMPHGLTVDFEGNVWVTDVGLHQAIKFDQQGNQLLVIGKRLEPGSDSAHLCKPTHVAVANDGTIFVADGYCNSRVVRYSATGSFEAEYRLPRGEMSIPHSVVLDECSDALYVADREHSEVHKFVISDQTLQGTWNLKQSGQVYSITVGPYGTILALCWAHREDPRLEAVNLVLLTADATGGGPEETWRLEGVGAPHDIALAASPMPVKGTGERTLALFVAETKPAGSMLRKFLFVPQGTSMADMVEAGVMEADQSAELIPGGHGVEAHLAHAHQVGNEAHNSIGNVVSHKLHMPTTLDPSSGDPALTLPGHILHQKHEAASDTVASDEDRTGSVDDLAVKHEQAVHTGLIQSDIPESDAREVVNKEEQRKLRSQVEAPTVC